MLTMPDVGRTRMLGGDILNQGSSPCNVHHLDAAANTEDRDTMTQRRLEEIDFKLVAVRIDAISRRVDVVVTVPHRIHVGASTQNETVDDCQEFVDRVALWG